MTKFDLPTLINWLASGFIGFIFGIAGTWITYRYERKRDDIAWKREKEKLETQFEQEKLLLEIQFQQRLKEVEQKDIQQEKEKIREQLLDGLDDPLVAIQRMEKSRFVFKDGTPNATDFWVYLDNKDESPIYNRIRWWAKTPKKVKLVLGLSAILLALLSLTLVLLITFIYKNM